MPEQNPEVVGFSPDLAVKIADMVRQTEGTKVSVASSENNQRLTYGQVSTVATAGTEASPTGGKFKMRDIFASGTSTSLDTNEVDFTNPYAVALPVGWIGLFVDTGYAWLPVLGAITGTAYGTLSSALASTDATASVSINSASPLNPSGSVTAKNWCKITAPINTECIVSLQGAEWILMQISC